MEILKKLNKGRLIAFDQDKDAESNIPTDSRFIFVRHNFRFLKNFLRYYGIDAIDGLIADLGVSSHHFDTPQRGFSFRFDANLDMRMNTSAGFSAVELINTYPPEELTRVFRTYGELQNARQLALKICEARNEGPIMAIREFLNATTDCLPKRGQNQYLAQVFQALRIEVNREIDYLKEMLVQAAGLLKPGGRIAVISYHSLEDRLVKNYFRSGSFENDVETDLFGNINRPLVPVNRKVIVPGEEEIKLNSRARSGRLRIAEKPLSN